MPGQQKGFEAGVGSLPLKDKRMGDNSVPFQVLVTPISSAVYRASRMTYTRGKAFSRSGVSQADAPGAEAHLQAEKS